MSPAHLAIVVAVIGAVAAIVAAFIQRDGPVKTERQSPPVQVNPQIQMNPQIVVNPQIQLAPQTQPRQSAATTGPGASANSAAASKLNRVIGESSSIVSKQAPAPIASPTNKGWPDYVPVTPIEKVE